MLKPSLLIWVNAQVEVPTCTHNVQKPAMAGNSTFLLLKTMGNPANIPGDSFRALARS